jgi:uncharacterized protein (DUF305 family)
MRKLLLAAGVLAVGSLAATGAELPAICTGGAQQSTTVVESGAHSGHDMAGMGGHEMGTSDAAHAALMAGMAEMNAQMDLGAAAEDIDVAFVCAMIPHHQGAIDMARAELMHGDDPWAGQMAQQIIDAQEQEIAQMLEWLSKSQP